MTERLQAGDVFASQNPWLIGRAINVVQKVWALDNKSIYGHTGIITGPGGDTIEALETVRKNNISAYVGKRVLIARPLADSRVKEFALETVSRQHLGQIYPGWRLILHLVPPLARRVSYKGKFLVCSEFTGKYLYRTGLRGLPYIGTTPDQLADEWHEHKGYRVIFEGVLPGTLEELECLLLSE